MTDPNQLGGHQAATIDHIITDDCHRESCLSLAEAQGVTAEFARLRSSYEADIISEAQLLLEASKQYLALAEAQGVTAEFARLRGSYEDTIPEAQRLLEASKQHYQATTINAFDAPRPGLNRSEQQATAHRRLTAQLAMRALLLLNQITAARSAQRCISVYLPAHRGDKTLDNDCNGEPTLSGTPSIFGTNRNGNEPPRPRHVALMDIALNHLVQQTHNWTFSRDHADDFRRDFLQDAKPGQVIDEATSNAWINRRLSQAETPANRG